jgi:hypothetical protein
MEHVMNNDHEIVPTGPASAAFVAAGVGCLALGVFTTLAEISVGAKNLLNWWNPAGPLTGKTGMAIVAWLAAWVVLHVMWKGQTDGFGGRLKMSLILIAMGLIGTFPTFFEMFSH